MWVVTTFLPLVLYPLGLALVGLIFVFLFRKRTLIWRFGLLACFLLLFLGGNRLVADWLLWQLESRYPPLDTLTKADVILVLGGVTEPPAPHRSTPEVNDGADRLIYAAQLYKQGVAPKILVTGGRTESLVPEADIMAELLMMFDVSDADIYRESRSFNTEDNARFSKQLMLEKGLDSAVLVTSAAHMRRAVLIFEELGVKVFPAPTDYRTSTLDYFWITDTFPEAKHLEKTTAAFKEYLGYLYLKLRGY